MTHKKIRVVYGLTDFIVGGMQRQFSEQLRFFDRGTFDIILITLSQHPEKSELYGDLPEWLPVHRLDFKGIADIRSWWRLWRLLRTLRPDIVVSSIFFANTVFRILKPVVGYISIAREHNTYIDKPALHQWVDRVLSHLSYRIVAVASGVAAFTAKQEGIPPEKFVTIQNGIDVQKARGLLAALPSKDELKRELGYGQEERVLLNVARLVGQKNHDVLIEGFALFRATHPEYRLAIVGAGGLQASLQKKIEDAGLQSFVRLFGMQSDVWRFYKAADVFVSAAGIEGLSNAELEACASGLPLVSTRTSGTEELLEEGVNGFFVRGLSVSDIADALEMAAHADPHSLRSASLKKVQEFDVRATVGAYEALFKEAASR